MAKKGKPDAMAVAKGTQQEPEVLTADDRELFKSFGHAITEFVRSVVEFFRTAKQLERRAADRLARARALRPPTDAESDEAIQRFGKDSQAEEKEFLEHWEITTLVHAFHRRLTGERKKGADMHEEARRIADKLHFGWKESERLRVAREAENDRREKEAAAQRERDEEVRKLEEQAIDAEAKTLELSDREQRFAFSMSLGKDPAVACARMAGYKDAQTAVDKLLKLPKIQAAIQGHRDAAAIRAQGDAVKQQPLDVDVEVGRMQVTRGISTDREWYSADILDEDALINAAIAGKVPRDILRVDPSKLNVHARQLGVLINNWPGVRAKKNQRMV